MANDAAITVKLDDAAKKKFVDTAESLGITPSGALKVFVAAFNDARGFPFAVRKRAVPYAIDTTGAKHVALDAARGVYLPPELDDDGEDDGLYDDLVDARYRR